MKGSGCNQSGARDDNTRAWHTNTNTKANTDANTNANTSTDTKTDTNTGVAERPGAIRVEQEMMMN